jgi:pimeloyl-ACP methyl ester carboxylesterase
MTNVVLLHGWPGSTDDFRRVLPLLPATVTPIVPALRGFGSAFDGELVASDATALAHAERVIDQLDGPAVFAGYDIGSRVAQTIARIAPELVEGLVVTPAYPGIGDRRNDPEMQQHFWYQHFHRNGLASTLLDGSPTAVRDYLRFIWSTWTSDQSILDEPEFESLVADYARPGAFTASIQWYTANRVPAAEAPTAVPTVMLWPSDDPLFPFAWADRFDEWFTNGRLEQIDSAHFVPLEAPRAFAAAIVSLAHVRAS